MEKPNITLPNIFYDLIVFVTPSLVLILGLLFGFLDFIPFAKKYIGAIGAIDMFFVILFALFIAYEYGRLAEALSSSFVSKPIHFLNRKKILFKNKDFYFNLSDEVKKLNLPIELSPDRLDSKWSIYFYALLHCPHIGTDLLKRYAWEKLARSSAFTFFTLFIISLIILLIKIFFPCSMRFVSGYFGSIYYSVFLLISMCLTYYEYYKRNCWNNDLIIKILPIIVQAYLSKEKLKNNSK